MFYQMYILHLLDGSVIEASEEYEQPAEKGLVEKFRTAEPNEVLEFGDPVMGFIYIPKNSIIYISTGDVREG